MTTGKPTLTEAEINDIMAKADGVIGVAGHVVSNPRARQIIRRKIAGEITVEEAERLLIKLGRKITLPL